MFCDISKLKKDIVGGFNNFTIDILKDTNKLDISKYTTDKDVASQFLTLITEKFFGVFVPPGYSKNVLILLNNDIYNTEKLYDTLVHELFHCKFYISNNNNILLYNNMEYHISYTFLDEYYARFQGYTYNYQHSYMKNFELFNSLDVSDLCFSAKQRITKCNPSQFFYEFVGLLASVMFLKEIRNFNIDIHDIFNCLDQNLFDKLINKIKTIDFLNVKENDLIDINSCLKDLWNVRCSWGICG